MSQVYETCHIWPISRASISCIRGKSSTITKCIYFCELSCHFVLRRDKWGMWWMNVSFHTWMNHVTWECVMSHVSESCHRWMNHATGEGDMKHVNESCHMWMCHVIRMSHVTHKWWEVGLLWNEVPACNNTLQHTAIRCNILQHTATHCNTLQHTATHYNALQRTATHCNTLQLNATCCNTLQHSSTHCNTLQHAATHCNTLFWYEVPWTCSKQGSFDGQQGSFRIIVSL